MIKVKALIASAIALCEWCSGSVTRKLGEDTILVQLRAGDTETKCESDDTKTCIGCAVGIIIACLIVGWIIGCVLVVLFRLRRHSQTGIRLSTLKHQKSDGDDILSEVEEDQSDLPCLLRLLTTEDKHQVFKSIEQSKYKDLTNLLQILHSAFPDAKLEQIYSTKGLRKVQNMEDKISEKETYEKKHHFVEKVRAEVKGELEETRKMIKRFPADFQDEAALLVNQYTCYTEDDFQLFARLHENHQVMRKTERREKLLLQVLQLRSTDQDDHDFIKLCHDLHNSTKITLHAFCKSVQAIEVQAITRQRLVANYLTKKEAEKKVWNSLVSGINNLARTAKRRSYIDKEEKRDIVEHILIHMTKAKKRYEEEQEIANKDLLKEIVKQQRYQQSNKTTLLRANETNLTSTALEKQDLEKVFEEYIEEEIKIDQIFMEKLRIVNENLSKEIRRQIRYAREKMKSLLLQKGVNEIWLDEQMKVLSEEEEKVLLSEEVGMTDDEDDITTLPPLQIDNGESEMQIIEQLQALQPSLNPMQRWKILIAQVATLRNKMISFPRQMIDERLDMIIKMMEQKRKLLSKISEMDDTNEDQMLACLEMKLQAWTEPIVEHVGGKVSTITCDRNFLGMFINESLSENQQITSLEKEKEAIEDLFMETMRLLVQLKIFTTSDCKSILHEHKNQYEEVVETFDILKKDREFELRRTIEADIFRKNAKKKAQVDETSINNLVTVGDEMILNSTQSLNEERIALQKLSLLQTNTYNEKLKALLEKELLLTRTLAKAGELNHDEINSCLHLMLPEAKLIYLRNITNVICQQQFDENKTNRFLYNKIKTVLEGRLQSEPAYGTSGFILEDTKEWSSSGSAAYDNFSYDIYEYERKSTETKHLKKTKKGIKNKRMIR